MRAFVWYDPHIMSPRPLALPRMLVSAAEGLSVSPPPPLSLPALLSHTHMPWSSIHMTSSPRYGADLSLVSMRT